MSGHCKHLLVFASLVALACFHRTFLPRRHCRHRGRQQLDVDDGVDDHRRRPRRPCFGLCCSSNRSFVRRRHRLVPTLICGYYWDDDAVVVPSSVDVHAMLLLLLWLSSFRLSMLIHFLCDVTN